MKLLNIFLGVPVLSQTTISEIYPESNHETIPSSTQSSIITTSTSSPTTSTTENSARGGTIYKLCY